MDVALSFSTMVHLYRCVVFMRGGVYVSVEFCFAN